jgi:hypothetical protein
MSAVSGGSPVRLVAESSDQEFAGSWSPDGNEYAFLRVVKGEVFLARVRTTGNATSQTIRSIKRASGGSLPIWSPSGEWILVETPDGHLLISPDGTSDRPLTAAADGRALGFSADGRTIYGLSRPTEATIEFFSLPVAGSPRTRIAPVEAHYLPSNSLGPSLQLSLSPDGKSFTYAVARWTSNLWLMDGVNEVGLR